MVKAINPDKSIEINVKRVSFTIFLCYDKRYGKNSLRALLQNAGERIQQERRSFMKKLLVVVDMQNDFIDGALGTEEAVKILEPVASKIKAAKSQGTEIIFTKDTHHKDYLMTQEGRKLPVPHCVKGTKGWELAESLKELAEGCRILEKPTFGSMELAEIAGESGYEDVELVGLCTDICVISNAMLLKAALPEAVIRVDACCCAGVTPKSHSNALEAMKVCQIEVEEDL